jgi:hypothetical protein
MIINLITDAPRHNLALMKLSTYFKNKGYDVLLNSHRKCDYTYVSLLFDKSIGKLEGDFYGGPAFPDSMLDISIEKCKPDYSLFNIDYSLGYSYRPCIRQCLFCKVPIMTHPDNDHHSIFEFHNTNFNKICLLNNNTFADKYWKLTFEEILSENLTVIDENGYDVRLIDDEKASFLKLITFANKIHFAWDRIKDEKEIIRGINILKKFKIHGTFYVLIGFDTNIEEDLYRCQVLKDNGFDMYIMPFTRSWNERAFKRFIDSFMWRKYKYMKDAWNDYLPLRKKNQCNKFKEVYK